MKKILTKIILCFLLFFLGINIAGAINIGGKQCETTGLTIEENGLFISKNRLVGTYSSYCSKQNIGTFVIHKSSDDTFIITNKGIYYDNSIKFYFDITKINIIKILSLLIFSGTLYLLLYLFHKHIEYIKGNKKLKKIIKITFYLVIIILTLNSIKYTGGLLLYQVIASGPGEQCFTDIHVIFRVLTLISLLYLFSYIKIWWLKSEQIKNFKDISIPNIKLVIFIIFLDGYVEYLNNVNSVQYIGIIIVWCILIFYIFIKHLKDTSFIWKNKNCPKVLKKLYLIILVLLFTTIKPILYYSKSGHCSTGTFFF